MRVLGIDPGSHVTGWGLVEAVAGGARQVASGVSTPRSRRGASRLGELADFLERLLDEWRPDAVAMERAFMGRNAMSALKLGEVRGALLAVAGRRGLDVVDYPPASVKVAVAGNGRAEKSAVAIGVRHMLGGRHEAGDSTDALAVALCHLLHERHARRMHAAAPDPRTTTVRPGVRRLRAIAAAAPVVDTPVRAALRTRARSVRGTRLA
ncbi:MAG: crossover junction endodeoxyribonuclease RuvC [Alphaproteobacteria bacterium]